jgi:TENA/THI-4/PQQC family
VSGTGPACASAKSVLGREDFAQPRSGPRFAKSGIGQESGAKIPRSGGSGPLFYRREKLPRSARRRSPRCCVAAGRPWRLLAPIFAASDNPYRAWIDTYAGEAFDAAVNTMIATTDVVGCEQAEATRAAMHAAFTRATQLEWMFWDSAYRREVWPV